MRTGGEAHTLVSAGIFPVARASNSRFIPDVHSVESAKRADGVSCDKSPYCNDFEQQPKRCRLPARELPAGAKWRSFGHF
jgi:hypothetical protein